MSKKKKIIEIDYDELCEMTEDIAVQKAIAICDVCGINHTDCPTSCDQYQYRNNILRVGSFSYPYNYIL